VIEEFLGSIGIDTVTWLDLHGNGGHFIAPN
jgi:hypothetical protein